MGLIGEINRGSPNVVAKFCGPGGMESGEVRGRSAADKKAAASLWKTAKAPEPIDHSELDRRRRGAAQPGAIENVEAGGERVPHRADEISGAGHEREEARMIDMKIIAEDVALEPSEQLIRIRRRFGRIAGELCEQVGRTLGANRVIAHFGEMFDEQIDDAITEPAHFVRGKL